MDYKIRSEQILSPFGIGQIINLPEELSVMVCGLDLWDEIIRQKEQGSYPVDKNLIKIRERRLEKLFGVRYFIKPFPYTDRGINSKLAIPAVRFPRWYHCTNDKCGRMFEVEISCLDKTIICPECQRKMIPVRFVAACLKGHIQDVPFSEWVHNGPVPDDGQNHFLKYVSLSGSGDLNSILIKCKCGKSKTLRGLMNIRKNGDEIYNSALAAIGLQKEEDLEVSAENAANKNSLGQYCKGYRPWLGKKGMNNDKECGEHLQVLIRGGSNIHYANIISSIYLPEVTASTNNYVVKVINRIGLDKLKSYYEQDGGDMLLPLVLENQPEVTNNTILRDDLLEGVIQEIEKSSSHEDTQIQKENIRQEEYNYILQGRDSENSDFKAVVKNFDNYLEGKLLKSFFECVILVEKLKETRVFTGFSRINPSNRVGMHELSNKKYITWLPACEVFGEGIFLQFRDDVIEKWQSDFGNIHSSLINRYHSVIKKRQFDYEERDINASFIMIHTFAHLLIKRLSFSCGYGSSSLRERIYFNSNPENRMNGVLIYTSSGDSEGSLGGLVRQGRENFLGMLVKQSIEDARWCSADPVCSDVGQSSGQGPDNINGSACHNCCIVPETSCEEFNMLLDRSTITNSLNNDTGFFDKWSPL